MTNEEYATAIQKGNTELAGELWMQIEKFMTAKTFKFFHMYAKPLIACGITLKDLQQESYFVMLEMVKAYKPEKNYKLLTYADLQFKNYIKRSLLGVNQNNTFRDLLNSASSIDEEIGNGDDTVTLQEITPNKQATQDFEDAEERLYHTELCNALSVSMDNRLTDEQRNVLYMRFWENKSMIKVAEHFNITTHKARQLEADALRKLRTYRKLRVVADEYIKAQAYHYTGLNSFRYNLASSQERIIERLEARYKH